MALYCEKGGNGADEVAPAETCERFTPMTTDSRIAYVRKCINCAGVVEL